MEKQDIKNYSLEELKAFLKVLGQREFHAQQLFAWIHQKGADSFDEMSNISLPLRNLLKEKLFISRLACQEIRESSDGTKKLLFKLKDASLIESALIPAERRNTACLSTQVGCKFCCRFCASGLSGFKRNLSAGEIISQALFIQKSFSEKRISHIVFMGTGEPLDNYENVLKAARIFNSPLALNIASRRITISTSGFIPGIKKLAQENLQLELSVSLHAGDDKTRDKLMPINKKYPLQDLIKECRDYYICTRRQITFEYILIHNLNCAEESARRLAHILKGFDFKLNLIPYNRVEEFAFEPPTKLEVLFFQNALSRAGIKSTLRMPRGRDINAACGQLRYHAQEQLKK